MKKFLLVFAALLIVQSIVPLFAQGVAAVTTSPYILNGATLSSWWALPFVGIILSIAVFPLVLPDFWSKHFGKVSFAWAAIVLIGLGFAQGINVSIHSFIAVMFEQFLPFIFLLLALFTLTGGIKMHGELVGTTRLNLLILLIGGILSSWLGTTGAAVLFIRPLINANAWRKFKVHTVIFFIFIVGNIGGTLTPVGNPPLLMGFISKVPFFWTLTKLLGPTAFSTIILLVLYYIIDSYYFRKENAKPVLQKKSVITIEGGWNLALLIAVIGAVMLSSANMGIAFTLYHVEMSVSELLEIFVLIVVVFVSMKITRKETREANNFTWHPILEVGKLFTGIFVCMAPLIAMLRAGADGPMSFIVHSLSANGHPVNGMYYWLSGGLSAFLDSAPAYLVFFNTAAAPAAATGLAPNVFMTTVIPQTLIAITAGASFMGAITYIGNAPNMMIKAIAEENGIKMPSFFGYMGWSVAILVPLFLLVQFVFI